MPDSRASAEPAPRLTLRVAARTDVGRKRTENEDAFGLYPDLSLFVVADGIGGHAGGKVASVLAVEAIHDSVQASGDDDLTPLVDPAGRTSVGGRRLGIAMADANERVLARSRNEPALQGMGAAVVAVLMDGDSRHVAVCHVGDTRAYRVRGGGIEQLTEDHTVVQRLLKAGKITPEEVATTPHRHVLTQALGVEPIVAPDLRLEVPRPDDVFVLTSDGIHDVVEGAEILEAVREAGRDLERICNRLVDLANARGGRDNSTVVVLACGAEDDDPTLDV